MATTTWEYRVVVKLPDAPDEDAEVWREWIWPGAYSAESPEWEKVVRNLRAETTWEVRLERRRVMKTDWRDVEVEA